MGPSLFMELAACSFAKAPSVLAAIYRWSSTYTSNPTQKEIGNLKMVPFMNGVQEYSVARVIYKHQFGKFVQCVHPPPSKKKKKVFSQTT